MRVFVPVIYHAPAPTIVEQAAAGQEDEENAGEGNEGVFDEDKAPMAFVPVTANPGDPCE
jgi:hypothetical protein